MNEKELVYNVFNDIWKLFKKYGFKPLTDAQWEKLIYESEVLSKKYRSKGKHIWMLFRREFDAVRQYYVEMNFQGKEIEGQMGLFQERSST